jgi:hypothetical protein
LQIELADPSAKDAATLLLDNSRTGTTPRVALTPNRSLSDEDKRAQRQAAQDDVLLREVDDAVRQDQYAEFAQKYGRLVVALVILAIALFGAYLFWQSRQENAREADSEQMIAALDQVEHGNLTGAAKSLDPLIADGKPGAQTAARLLKAGIAMQQNKPAEAARLYEQVAADGDAPQALRDAATVRAVAATYDTTKPADVVARLKPLAVPGNAWFGSAGELVAMAYLDQGKRAEAGALFAAIAKDENTPETLRNRARQMAGLLGVDAIENVEKLVREQQAGEGAAPQPAPAQ